MRMTERCVLVTFTEHAEDDEIDAFLLALDDNPIVVDAELDPDLDVR